MKLKVWDYLKEYENEKDEIFDAIKTVLDSGWLILGEQVKSFEEEFSAYSDAKYGIGVDNGTDALFLALKAIGIGEGDEVITVSNTAVPTVSAIVSTGATPVFAEIQPDTYLMDVAKIEQLITDKTKCIIPVHLFGQCVDMDPLNEIADKNNIAILEDCAQSHGATYKGKKCGSLSALSAFSFYPTKPLGTYGDGGMVITSDEAINAKMRKLRFYGMEQTYYSVEHGYNSRLDEIHAAILRKKLTHLDDYITRRRELAKRYNEMLSDTDLVLPIEAENNKHVYYIYVVRHPKRDKLREELRNNDIFVNISYPWPIHTMTGYKHLGYKQGDLPITEKAQNEILSLPMYPTLTNDEQEHCVEVIKKILKKI